MIFNSPTRNNLLYSWSSCRTQVSEARVHIHWTISRLQLVNRTWDIGQCYIFFHVALHRSLGRVSPVLMIRRRGKGSQNSRQHGLLLGCLSPRIWYLEHALGQISRSHTCRCFIEMQALKLPTRYLFCKLIRIVSIVSGTAQQVDSETVFDFPCQCAVAWLRWQLSK